MSRIGIWVVAMAGGEEIGAWLVDDDVDARDGRGTLQLSQDPAEARVFAHIGEALDYWRRPSQKTPLRPDGRPNRPLTAFTVELRSLEGETSR
jgi:hypothetical protein